MTNIVYPKGKQNLLDGVFTWSSSNEGRIVLLPSTYTYDANDNLLSDITAKGVSLIATSGVLANPLNTDAYIISDPTTFSALDSGGVEVASMVLIVRDTGTTDFLLAFMDEVSNFPFTPNGGNYQIAPGGPNSSWFRL